MCISLENQNSKLFSGRGNQCILKPLKPSRQFQPILMYTTLIIAQDLRTNLKDPDWVIVDCRYDLADTNKGRDSYLESHIPGAVFADVHDDLSGPPLTDHGRHPMPSADHLNRLFGRLGIRPHTQVVVYDDSSGAFAGRLWWLLRYMGHQAVAVLDGGWQAWQENRYPVQDGEEKNPKTEYLGSPHISWLVTVDQVQGCPLLVDSRDPKRYRGEHEPIDSAAGHIPGAINHFWQDNLDARGRFKNAEELKQQFAHLFADVPSDEVVFYCGSGVTACHNLLAIACAGMPAARLYAGSWSDWCSDPQRLIQTGNTPGVMS